MNKNMIQRLTLLAAIITSIGLTGCAGMTHRQQNTAAGAAVGGIAGSVLTGGSALGTIGGAAIGGYIGNSGQADYGGRRNRR
jgi:osmotically inducible lipoprotein OsmB